MWSVVVSATAKGDPVLAVHDTSNVDRLSPERSVRQGKNNALFFMGWVRLRSLLEDILQPLQAVWG